MNRTRIRFFFAVMVTGMLLTALFDAMASILPEEPYDNVVVLDQSEEPEAGGVANRVTLAESGFKYPILRITETVTGGTNVLSQSAVVGDHIMVKVHEGTTQADLEALNAQLGGTIRQVSTVPQVYLVAFTNVTVDTVGNAVTAYAAATNVVLYAEPDGILGIDSFTPNDPMFGNQWGLQYIDAPEAWDTSRGDGVVVAVFDTGVDYNHEDLRDNIWSNANEIAGNGIDDDGNGYIDDVHGWDFYSNDSNPMDVGSHGTHVAGTIAAVGNNSSGVVGVAWQTKIMSVKIFGYDNGNLTASMSDAMSGVYYVLSRKMDGVPVRVTNHSWGGGGYSQILRDALRIAGSFGILHVAAAGNDSLNFDNGGPKHYPSCYDEDSIISVASMNSDGSMSGFSNRGVLDVDLSAPGGSILSTVPGNGYGTKSGTSMAAPHVAGVAALLFSHDPGVTLSRARRLLLDGVDPLSTEDLTATDGCVNAARSLEFLDAVAAPSFHPAGGIFTNIVQVAIQSEDTGATIHFTTNGVDPDQSSPIYTGPLTIDPDITLKARTYATGQQESRIITAEYIWRRVRVKRWALNHDPGWTTEGLWDFGVPLGMGAGSMCDPTSGVGGTNVYGYNLAGDYEKGITRALTTSVIDCSHIVKTQLRFKRWLSLYQGGSSVQASTDGSSWEDVWVVSSTNAPHIEDAVAGWTEKRYDISNIADGQPSVYLRWVMGPTDASAQAAGGWNVDDIEIWGAVAPSDMTYSEPSWAF